MKQYKVVLVTSFAHLSSSTASSMECSAQMCCRQLHATLYSLPKSTSFKFAELKAFDLRINHFSGLEPKIFLLIMNPL